MFFSRNHNLRVIFIGIFHLVIPVDTNIILSWYSISNKDTSIDFCHQIESTPCLDISLNVNVSWALQFTSSYQVARSSLILSFKYNCWNTLLLRLSENKWREKSSLHSDDIFPPRRKLERLYYWSSSGYCSSQPNDTLYRWSALIKTWQVTILGASIIDCYLGNNVILARILSIVHMGAVRCHVPTITVPENV